MPPASALASIGTTTSLLDGFDGEPLEGLHVLVRDEVAERRLAGAGRRLGHHLGRARLRLRQPLARLGVAERRLLPALGGEDQRRLLAFGALDGGGAVALGLHHRGAALALGGHLEVHGAHQVLRRLHLADLDAADLHAPGVGGAVERDQQGGVDALAPAQGRVEVHLADHRADVGHGERRQRAGQVLHLVGRLGRVHHPVIDDAVHGDGRVVAGDDRLLGDVEHHLLHVHLAPDVVDVGDDEVQPRLQQPGEGAEPLHRPDLSPAARS